MYIAQQQETEKRTEFNKEFYKNEKIIHGNKQNVLICLKNTFTWNTCSQIIDDEFPGVVARNLPKKATQIKDTINTSSFMHLILYLFKKTRTITNIYLDLFKDLLLVITVISAVGGLDNLFNHITNFPSVVSKYKNLITLYDNSQICRLSLT